VIHATEPGGDAREPTDVLSPRELEVLGLASTGLTNGDIATRLSLSVHAVKFHLAAVYRKLAVTNRTEAAAVYIRSTSMPPNSGMAS
jgi:DNA-binding CsgD family transcriptional regulator